MRIFFTLLVLFTLCGTLQAQDPCPNNHSLDFTPTSPGSDYLQPASPPIASGASDFTLEARFRCESPAGSSFRRLLSMGGSGTGSAQFEVCESNGYLRFFWGTTVYPTGTPPATLFIKDGNWHHVAAVRSGSGFLVYIDGVLVFTSPTSLPAFNNFTRLRIGAFWNGVSATTAWDGQIDEVRVWNTVRTPTQISTYRNCPLPTCSESGLVLYYKLDEGVAYGSNPNVTLADDCSPNNNNGTLTGPFALTGTSSNWVCGDSLFGTTCCPADFSWTRDSCGNVQFTNLTQQPVPPTYTYAWDFDNDGVTDSTLPNPSWNYPTQGNHTVCLSLITATGAVFCETCKTVASLSFLTGPPIIVTCSPDVSLNCGDPYQVPIPVVSNNYCSDQLNITGSRSDLQLMNAPFPLGITVITWTATNEFGSSTCTNTVTVFDNAPPVAICQDVVVNLSGSTVTVTPQMVDNGSFDDCCPVTLSFPNAPNGLTFNCQDTCPLPPQTVVLLVTDCSGNTSTCTAQVTVVDNEPPTIACPPDLQYPFYPDLCLALVSAPPFTLTDNCEVTYLEHSLTGATNSIAATPIKDIIFNEGWTHCTYLAQDQCGNTTTCSFSIFVFDPETPTITCPSSINIGAPPNSNGTNVFWTEPIANDNCSTPFVNSNYQSGNFFMCGVTVVNYTATDASDNSATCSFQVRVLCPPPPSCECGGFTNLAFVAVGAPAGLSVACNQAFTVPCPVAGTNFSIAGQFACSDTSCAASNLVWELHNSSGMIGSGNLGGVNFTLPIAGNMIQTPGSYTLYLRGDCGQTTCQCEVLFVVSDCPETCENRALSFDGIDDVMTVSPCPVQGDADFTVEAIFTSTATNGGSCGGNFRRLFSFGGTNSRFEVGECAGLMSIYWFNGSGNGAFQISDQNIRDSNCHHIAVIRQDDSVRVLLDGILVYTTGGISPLNTSYMRIGQWVGGPIAGENWQGLIDEVRLWNYPRSDADILANNSCELLGTESGLVGYWPMNQGIAEGNNPTVTQCTDIAGNDQPGVLANFALNGTQSNWVCGCELCGQSDCQDFNDQSFYNWGGVGINGPFIVNPGPSGLTNDFAMYAEDGPGGSLVINPVDFDGNWLTYDDSCFCYDIRVFNDGSTITNFPIYPLLIIYNHPNTNTNMPGIGPLQAARFESNFFITENTGWVRICAPIGPCVNGALPSDGNGVWTMTGSATSCSDWSSLLQNITHIALKIDYHSNPAEDIYWDNFCFAPCDTVLPEINCEEFSVNVSPLSDGNGECCSTVSITNNTGISDLTSLFISCAGANFTNVVVPTGYTVSQPQPYQMVVRPPSGTFIPAGQVNDLVKFCLEWIEYPWLGNQPDFPVKITINLNRLTPDDNMEYRVCTDSIFVCGATNCDTSCIAQSLNISTGYDPVTGNILAPGNSDPLWTTVSVPPSSSIVPPLPANIVGIYPGWSHPSGSEWLSAMPFNNYSINNCSPANCDCEPFVYERCFCLCEADSVTFNFLFYSDDNGEVVLWDGTNEIHTFVNDCNSTHNFVAPDTINQTLFLQKGNYCLRIKHWNTHSVAMGVNLNGTVSGLNLEQDTCCANPNGGILGTKYRDLDCDSVRDINSSSWTYVDPGLSGWTFTLTGNGITATAVSNVNGQFYFPNLPPGTYTITETGQPLYEPSNPSSGSVTVIVNAFGITEVDFGNCYVCDFITPTVSKDTSQTGCCHTLSIDNNKPDYFTYVNLSVIDGGSLVTSPPPTTGTGWTLQGFSSSSAFFQPSGGGTIPTGTQQVADFCLENLTADEQTIVIEYYGLNDSVVCRDTLTLKCDACVQAIVDSVYCESWNQYSANICIKAGENLGSPAGSATLVPLGGVTFSVALPNITESDGSVVVSLPDVQPGDTYCSIPIQINGATGGQQVCFYAIIHDGDIPAGEDDLFCCADTIPVCFQLPECDPCSDSTTYATAEQMVQNGDSCCWEITLHNPPGYYIGVSTEIVTPGVTFGAVNNFPPTSGWLIGSYTPTDITWDPFGVQGTYVQDGWMMPVICFDGTVPGPWELAVTWYAEDSTECYDTLSFLCTPPDDNECVRLDTFDLVCIDDSTYIFNFTATNVSSDPTITADHVVLGQIKPTPPPYNVFDPATHWQTLLPNASGSFSSLLYGNPGDTICFVIALHDVNDDSLHLYCCVSDTFCVVLPPCSQQVECVQNILVDGEFLNTYDPQFQVLTDYWVAYNLSTPGHITYDSCALNNAVEMQGTQLSGEGIYQKVNFFANHLYAIRLCARYVDPFSNLQPKIRLFADDGAGTSTYPASGCSLPDCELIGFTPVLGTDWAYYTFNWVADNNYTRLVLTPWNQSLIPGQEIPSTVRIDRICVDDYGIVLPDRPEFSVRAYPNPTSGDLTLAFESVLTTSATLRVFDMFGRLVKTERVAEAQLQYELSLNGLPQGVYFVEIGGTEGRLWGQRIVKE